MSTEVIRELFRNVENSFQTSLQETQANIHNRLKVIEEILCATRHSYGAGDTPSVQGNFNALESHVKSLEEYTMGEVRTLAYNHDMLEKRVELLESSMKTASETLMTINSTIGALQKRMEDDRPVEAVEVEAEIEAAQEAALNADLDATATEKHARDIFVKAVEELDEEADDEASEAEVEEEQEEEEEEEEQELEAFEYKKKTYARDQNNNLYSMDEEGCADTSEIIGIWNPTTKKIDPVPEEEEQEEELELEAFEYAKKSYCRDQHNKVYVLDEEGCADTSQMYGVWNPKTKKIERVPNA
jgi:hypothetical protein